MSHTYSPDAVVSQAFSALLSTNRGPHPTDPDQRLPVNYEVSGSIVDDTVNAEVRFLAGESYCCLELGCHLRLRERDWARLRESCEEHGVFLPKPMRVVVTCIVEEGSRIFDFCKPVPAHSGYYRFKSVKAYEYSEEYVENPSAI